MLEAAQITASMSLAGLPRRGERLLGGLDGDLGQHRDLVVGALRDVRAHAFGSRMPALSITKRDLMPDAFSMNSTQEGTAPRPRRPRSPRRCSALNARRRR